jgi:ABC-type phosphate/phosphonate transport system substrate-binding protein
MSLGLTSLLSPVSDHRLHALIESFRESRLEVRFVDGTWAERRQALDDGDAEIGWLCGLLHADLQAGQRWPLHAVAAPRSSRDAARGQPVYFGDVVVAEKSPRRNMADLEGAVFAYNEEASLSGYRMMLDALGAAGKDLAHFGRSIQSGSHMASMDLVRTGDADCAIIDSTLIDDLEPAGLVVIESIGPYPAPPLVAVPDHVESVGAAAAAAGWVRVDDRRYDTLRRGARASR